MACLTLFAPSMAMATTQLTHTIQQEAISPWRTSARMERSPLRMSWVVATDSDGNRQLRMQWASAADR